MDSLSEECEKTAQIVSSKRVADHGEVYTNPREVNAMLDLVKSETERIESRFLEPACGNGNFLVEILRRKLLVVSKRAETHQREWEFSAFLATASIYGIDILPDNISACRKRLFQIIESEYRSRFGEKCVPAFLEAVKFLLSKNILWGDALTIKMADGSESPLVFSSWAAIGGIGRKIKRHDFSFQNLVNRQNEDELFPTHKTHKNDRGENVYFPQSEHDFPPINFLKISETDHA